VALDTREKRASVVSLNPGAPPSPTPNAAMDQEWRQQSGWGYSGILVGVPVVGIRRRNLLIGGGLLGRQYPG